MASTTILGNLLQCHGGAPIRIFSPSVYKVLCGQKACDIIVSIDEVPDEEIRTTLKKVRLHYSLLFIV